MAAPYAVATRWVVALVVSVLAHGVLLGLWLTGTGEDGRGSPLTERPSPSSSSSGGQRPMELLQPPPRGQVQAEVDVEVQVQAEAAARRPGERRARARRVEAAQPPAPQAAGLAPSVEEPSHGGADLSQHAGASSGGGGGGSGTSRPTGRLDVARLEAALRRASHGCYPAAARRYRLKGTVVTRFCLGEDGGLEASSIERTSGAAVLDRAAVSCVLLRAMPLVAPAGCYSLPVRFE